MAEETSNPSNTIEDRRQQWGTWPWFVLNVVLFPAPAHFTLLRIKDFRFGKSVRHLGVTFLLICVLLVSASLQVVFPSLNRLWMIFPLLSGLFVLYANYSLKKNFTPFDITAVTRTHLKFSIFLIVIFTILSILPDLDLVELNRKQNVIYKTWFAELPFWQDLLILLSGFILLLTGYITNASVPVSINRAFILYACFFVFINLLVIILVLVTDWLKIKGGFGTQLIFILFAAILAIDYWDANSFGQYTRRFFFLTSTKILYFVVLWLCFLGLPQKSASIISATYFNKSRPPVIKDFDKYLVFSHRDRFESAHKASHRMRALISKALYSGKKDELIRISGLLTGKKDSIFPEDADICRMADLINQREIKTTPKVFDAVPIFRPLHPEWDVMLTALLMQGTVSKADLNNFIADFKSKLPKRSGGRLPDISTLSKARYVSLSTDTRIDFVPPRFALLENLVTRNYCPVLSLRLAGKNYWAALLDIDRQSGLAWFRMETLSKTEKSIQVLFDSNESGRLKDEIFSRLMIPLPLSYFREALEHYSGAVVVFTPSGLSKALPDLFAEEDLVEMDRAVAFASGPMLSTPRTIADPQGNRFSEYAAYTRVIAIIKALLEPTPYKQDLFAKTTITSFAQKGIDRIGEIEILMGQIATLRDCDRVDISNLLVENNHVSAAADLFVRLTTEKQVPSDLIDCHDAFNIGRKLFLLGLHEKAYRYLKLAFLRHPFDADYEMWYHLTREKLNKPPIPFYSPAEHQPDLQLFYATLADIREGHHKAAIKRLENRLKKDSHDSLATHLLSKYFNRPLDERHFFPAQEGL